MDNTFDCTKPVATKCGFEAKINCCKAGEKYPIAAEIVVPLTNGDTRTIQSFHRADGTCASQRYGAALDLVNVCDCQGTDIVRTRGFINVYEDGTNELCPNRKEADEFANLDTKKRVACIEFDWDVQKGVGIEGDGTFTIEEKD